MLVPKKNRLAVYNELFKEGVFCCKKDVTGKHNSLEIPNIHAMKLMQSLTSRGYVREKYNWLWLYYTLTDEGIEYLREYLHVPAETVPATLKKSEKPQPPPSFGQRSRFGDRPGRRGRGGYGNRDGGRDGYRGPKKTDGAPDGFKPEFGGRREGGRGRFGGGRGRGRGDRQ